MDMIEKLNQKFTGWYESLFGEFGNAELRPKDVLRKILNAMDADRSEGIDGKVYVPNRYILVLNLPDRDEREYLLAFLDEGELAAVVNRYMAQNGYAVRGSLDFIITDSSSEPGDFTDKLTVLAKFAKDSAIPAQMEPPANAKNDDLPTVGGAVSDDLATVANVGWASFEITQPGEKLQLITLVRPSITIGRSRSTGNDIVLASDGKVSKIHARIERDADGRAVLFDSGSTNGVTINGARLHDSGLLDDGDTVQIGDSLLIFHQSALPARPESPIQPKRRAVLSPLSNGPDHVLASDTLIGRAVTCDLVLDDIRCANRQAQIVALEEGSYTVEDLSGQRSTMINDRIVHTGERIKITNGDRIQFGSTTYQYLEKTG